MKNITNKTKTILFASLIAAMILPFSGMQSAQAVSYEETQQKLIQKLEAVEAKLDKATNENRIEKLEAEKQDILKQIFENAKSHNSSEIVAEVTESNADTNTVTAQLAGQSNFNINGSHSGCDSANETWNFKGTMTSGSGWISINQNFPSELTSGSAPNCSEWNWQSNLNLDVQAVFGNTGCVGNLITAPVTSYWVNCQTPISGLWVVEIVADYEQFDQTGYTYVSV